MTRLELCRHPRWPLYKKLRRAVARELEAEQRRRDLARAITPDDVDLFLENHIGQVLHDINCLFWDDLVTNTVFVRPEDAHRGVGGLH